MKRFIISVLCVAVFFIGLGSLVEKTGARFKSDERALEIIKQARAAIGGEAAIKNVSGLTVTGRVAQTFNLDGTARTEQGDLEINLQLPNRFAKVMKFARQNDGGIAQTAIEKNVVVLRKSGDKADFNLENSGDGRKKVFIMKKGDGDDAEALTGDANANIKKIFVDKNIKFNHAEARQNELFRTTFALLLTAPEGSDVNYTYGGEGDVDGNSCDVILAQLSSDAVKIFIDKSTHLPLMMSYQGTKPFVIKINKNETASAGEKNFGVITRSDAPEIAEIQVKFSDYRSVGDVRLPFQWTQTANGQPDRNVDVSSYDINPANISEKFTETPNRIMIRAKKPE
ncbi:MAG TPA: hypothetical protein VNI84_09975 [Pyrinomonadaceae bacterium]|nr:hypothetical protein [Pyrinomonadaceae bacterium]